MTEAEMKRAIGLLVDALADAAFQGGDIDGGTAQELLAKAGLTFIRPATEADCADAEYDCDVGDEWHALTPFAAECRKAATVA